MSYTHASLQCSISIVIFVNLITLAQRLMLLTYFREVPFSNLEIWNLGWNTGCSERFRDLHHLSQANVGMEY
jgi:hypothetical protein